MKLDPKNLPTDLLERRVIVLALEAYDRQQTKRAARVQSDDIRERAETDAAIAGDLVARIRKLESEPANPRPAVEDENRVVREYRGLQIKIKRDFGRLGNYDDNGNPKGYVVTDGYCNVMPGATYAHSVLAAQRLIDAYFDAGGEVMKPGDPGYAECGPDAAVFWDLVRKRNAELDNARKQPAPVDVVEADDLLDTLRAAHAQACALRDQYHLDVTASLLRSFCRRTDNLILEVGEWRDL